MRSVYVCVIKRVAGWCRLVQVGAGLRRGLAVRYAHRVVVYTVSVCKWLKAWLTPRRLWMKKRRRTRNDLARLQVSDGDGKKRDQGL